MADTPSGGNVFTRHIGPLPMWGWTAIVGGVLIGWAWWSNRNSSGSSSTGATANASQVPQFVNQVYTNGGPPSAPSPTDDDDTDTGPVESFGGIPAGGNKYVTSGGKPRDWVQDKLKLSPAQARLGGPDFTVTGQPRKDVAGKLKGKRPVGKKAPRKSPGKKAVHPGGHPVLRRAVRGG